MKKVVFFKSLKKTILALSILLVSVEVSAADVKPSGDTVVYRDGDAKRVHVEGCKRLTKDPNELAKMTKMTFAEAEKQGLPLCSKCPGSTTPGNSKKNDNPNPDKGDKGVKGEQGKLGEKGKDDKDESVR